MSTTTEAGYHFHYIPSPEKYEHSPLVSASHIRLLILLKPDKNSCNAEPPLTGAFLQQDLHSSSALDYHALCPVPDSRPATMSIETAEGFVRITPALYKAISALRRISTSAILLWTPDVCIDPENDEVQVIKRVQNMKNIYMNASEVIAYLGEDPDDTGDAHEVFAKLAHMDLSKLPKSFDELKRVGLPPTTHNSWVAVDRFLSRPWFRSMQALPACVWAKNLRFVGERWSMEATMFIWAMIKAKALSIPIFGHGNNSDELIRGARCFSFFASLRVQYEASGTQFTFSELLERCRLAESNTSLEKLEILAAISTKGDELDLLCGIKDCAEAGQRVQAHQIVSFFFENTDEGVELLSLAGGCAADPDTATWMPDMSPKIDARGLDYSIFETTSRDIMYEPFTSCGDGKLAIKCSPIPCSCPGHNAIAKIINVPTQGGGTIWSSVLAQWQHAQGLCGALRSETGERLTKYPATGEQILDAIWETLRKGKQTDAALSLMPQSVASAKAIFTALTAEDMMAVVTQNFESAGDAVAFLADELDGYRFCVTQTGYMALVPEQAEDGDVIMAIQGTHIPFVVRTVPGKDEYRLVGGCYFHGAMNGELREKMKLDVAILV